MPDPETSPPELTKYKCLRCKRDLSLTSEGAVYQPTAPPAVAVLPCGHTFHDQCLQKITPQDQAKDPPCIPCAIGENQVPSLFSNPAFYGSLYKYIHIKRIDR